MKVEKYLEINRANIKVEIEIYPDIGEDKREKCQHTYAMTACVANYSPYGSVSYDKLWKKKEYFSTHHIDDTEMIVHNLQEIEKDIKAMYIAPEKYSSITKNGWKIKTV